MDVRKNSYQEIHLGHRRHLRALGQTKQELDRLRALGRHRHRRQKGNELILAAFSALLLQTNVGAGSDMSSRSVQLPCVVVLSRKARSIFEFSRTCTK